MKKLSIALIILGLVLALSVPKPGFAEAEDREFFNFGIAITYAGLCLKKMNIHEDAVSENENKQLAKNLTSRFGMQRVMHLQSLAMMGLQQFEADQGANCPQMLTVAKNMINNYGVRSSLIDKALAIINDKSGRPLPPPPVQTQKNSTATRRLSDDLHNDFLASSDDYALADAMLNATWKALKRNLPKSQFSKVQQEQRAWLAKMRDKKAAEYAQDMPLPEAYARAIQERVAILASLVSTSPKAGKYENPVSEFSLSSKTGEFELAGDAFNEHGNTCTFLGEITPAKGWIKVPNNDTFYYVLFTPTGATIEYTGSGSSQGCGAGVDFKGEYTFK